LRPVADNFVRCRDECGFHLRLRSVIFATTMRKIDQYRLSNGIRIVHSRVATTKIVHCGIMLDIGSRDETTENQGIAHFWEHMAFKGTRKRKAFHILNRLDSVGGELNAFTDKEKILFYASVRNIYFDSALELLADITFDSIFPTTQIERERHVILEEMAMYQDDPDDSLQDEFDRVVFTGHPLGMNILGTQKTVRSFRRRDFQNFIRLHLDTRKVVFSCVGDMDMDQVIRLAEKYLGHIPKKIAQRKRKKFTRYKPKQVLITRDVKQARCALGRPAYSRMDKRKDTFFMLTNILGGTGINSRLNDVLREKRGYVYSIGAYCFPFTDTGLFMVSFGTEPSQMKKSLSLIMNELRKLREKPLGVKQLTAAREQLLGQLAMAEENNQSFMMRMARSILDAQSVEPLEELQQKIYAISAQQLVTMANDLFQEDQFSFLHMAPR